MYVNVAQYFISTAAVFGIATLRLKISETAFYTVSDLMDAPFIKNYYYFPFVSKNLVSAEEDEEDEEDEEPVSDEDAEETVSDEDAEETVSDEDAKKPISINIQNTVTVA